MSELGPLKFGLNPSLKGAADSLSLSKTFRLLIGVTGGKFDLLALAGPSGATASIDWGTTASAPRIFTGGAYVQDTPCGSLVTITGSSLIHYISLRQSGVRSITGITGTYPTALNAIFFEFNNTNPTWTIPNIPKISIVNTGPTSLTFGSKLTNLFQLPSNLTSLNVTECPLLTSLCGLPRGVSSLTPSLLSTSLDVSGSTGLTLLRLPPKLVSLNISGCSGLTGVSLPPTLANLKIEGSGLTSLDLTKTSIATLNIPPSMYPQLQTLKLTGGKMNLTGLLNIQIPAGANWTLY